MTVPAEKLIWMYQTMYRIRYYEETMASAYKDKTDFSDIGGPAQDEMHSAAAGQEPAAVGICAHLHKDDTLTASYRSHYNAIAKGVDLYKMTAAMLGKAAGLGRGNVGRMHLFDPAVKFCCGSAASGLSHAVGAALAAKTNKKDWVAVGFIGEGAANAGAFRESVNMAALWRLPVIFVIENHSYSFPAPNRSSVNVRSNDMRGAAYGIPCVHVNDNDPLVIYRVSEAAVRRARAGEGPTIIEIGSDSEAYHATGKEPEPRRRDPLLRLKCLLLQDGAASEEQIAALEGVAKRDMDQAYAFARSSLSFLSPSV